MGEIKVLDTVKQNKCCKTTSKYVPACNNVFSTNANTQNIDFAENCEYHPKLLVGERGMYVAGTFLALPLPTTTTPAFDLKRRQGF